MTKEKTNVEKARDHIRQARIHLRNECDNVQECDECDGYDDCPIGTILTNLDHALDNVASELLVETALTMKDS